MQESEIQILAECWEIVQQNIITLIWDWVVLAVRFSSEKFTFREVMFKVFELCELSHKKWYKTKFRSLTCALFAKAITRVEIRVYSPDGDSEELTLWLNFI